MNFGHQLAAFTVQEKCKNLSSFFLAKVEDWRALNVWKFSYFWRLRSEKADDGYGHARPLPVFHWAICQLKSWSVLNTRLLRKSALLQNPNHDGLDLMNYINRLNFFFSQFASMPFGHSSAILALGLSTLYFYSQGFQSSRISSVNLLHHSSNNYCAPSAGSSTPTATNKPSSP